MQESIFECNLVNSAADKDSLEFTLICEKLNNFYFIGSIKLAAHLPITFSLRSTYHRIYDNDRKKNTIKE